MPAGRFTFKFKTKVVQEALKKQQTTQALVQKFEVFLQQIGTWKREFLKEAVFLRRLF